MHSKKYLGLSLHIEPVESLDLGWYRETSYHDAEVEATYKELKEMFHEPQVKCDGEKTHCCFYLVLIGQEEGIRAITVYDYKFKGPFTEDTLVSWHIGGNGTHETFLAKDLIEEYLEDLRNGRVVRTELQIVCEGDNYFSKTPCPFGEKSDTGEPFMVGCQHCFFDCDYLEATNVHSVEKSGNEEKLVVVCRKSSQVKASSEKRAVLVIKGCKYCPCRENSLVSDGFKCRLNDSISWTSEQLSAMEKCSFDERCPLQLAEESTNANKN